MSKLKIRNTDNTFSEVATVDYVDSRLEEVVTTDTNTTYTITKSGTTITLRGSDGSTSTVNDSDTKVTIDSSLSSTSTNPIQNKAVYNAINNLADTIVIDCGEITQYGGGAN